MEKIEELIQNAGIVGAGGAGFPTHVKLSSKAKRVIINGAECEPLLRVDQQLMAMYPDEILQTLNLVLEHAEAEEGIIALKKKYHDAIDAFNARISSYPKIKLNLMDNFYPAGDEQVMVYETTGEIVPEGSIPISVSAIVLNVETVLNIYNAYFKNSPVTHTYVTVTGEVKNKKTVKVPIGITVSEAIDLAGGALIDKFMVINGGPMMGKVISLDEPITKTVKGLIVLPEDHALLKSHTKSLSSVIREAKTACMHCSLCTEVCPRKLLGHRIEPHKLIRLASYGGFCDSTTTPENAFLCCSCRLCEYACVMGLQPWKVNNMLKSEMSANGIKNTLNQKPKEADVFREYKKFPVTKLITRLGLSAYDAPAPYDGNITDFKKVSIPLKQHTGTPCEPIVNKGDTVNSGDLIGEIKNGQLGAKVHASINGVVKEVNKNYIVIESK